MLIEEEEDGFDLESQLNLLDSMDDEQDDENDGDINYQSRRAAVQAAMMGIPTRFQNHQDQSFRMDTPQVQEQQDDKNSYDWRMDLEDLVKMESDQEELHSLHPAGIQSETSLGQATHDSVKEEEEEGEEEEEEEEEEEQDSHQSKFNLSLVQLDSPQEFFMKDKPGVAGLPLKGPNSTKSPVYVNPKQYDRIMKRRIARARLEEMGRLSRERKPYLHESRHKHALRRPRGPRGRFLTKEELAIDQTDKLSINPTLETTI